MTGFKVAGKDWYLDPVNPDSNGDSILDSFECSQLEDVFTDGTLDTGFSYSACQDTDGNDIPDVYDFDNDGDGVPDSSDSSPYDYRTITNQNIDLYMSNFQTGKSIFVDIEVRPTDDRHLWYTDNVLDWSDNDDAGQVMRVTDDTLTDDGDMILKPMLEILIPYASDNKSRSLPISATLSAIVDKNTPVGDWLDQGTLDDYGITVTQEEDTGRLYVYVPLTAVHDQTGDSPVAWAGRMYYRPDSGESNWGGNGHEIRLLWLVTALNDFCTVPSGEDAKRAHVKVGGETSPRVTPTLEHWIERAKGVKTP